MLATDRQGQRLLASSLLVKPEAPVSTAHFTGAVVDSHGDQTVLMDGNGNMLTADLFPAGGGVDPTVATGVIRQDVRSGSITVLGAEAFDTKLDRLESALTDAVRAGAEENARNLGQRLKAATAGHLTTVQNILDRVDPAIRGRFADALESAALSHGELLADFQLGNPCMKVSGVMEVVRHVDGVVRISQAEGPDIEITITDSTDIREFGEPSRSGNLVEGQRVEATYDRLTNQALSLNVLFPTLEPGLASYLLRQIRTMELEGTVSTGSRPGSLIVILDTGRAVTLATTGATQVRVSDAPGTRADLVVGDAVKVRYNPATLEALRVDTFDRRPDRGYVSGAVTAFISKIRPGLVMPGHSDEGNIAVLTPSGQTVVLDIGNDTVVERNGLRVNIGAVRKGDLVRPVSRYSIATGELQVLTLQEPELTGFVRGAYVTPAGNRWVTISTDNLHLITMRVADETAFQQLAPGQRVRAAAFTADSTSAPDMQMEPSRVTRSSGVIAGLDKAQGIVTMTTSRGDDIRLLVPQKPGIVTLGGVPSSIEELNVGDTVLVVYYRSDMVVTGMTVAGR